MSLRIDICGKEGEYCSSANECDRKHFILVNRFLSFLDNVYRIKITSFVYIRRDVQFHTWSEKFSHFLKQNFVWCWDKKKYAFCLKLYGGAGRANFHGAQARDFDIVFIWRSDLRISAINLMYGMELKKWDWFSFEFVPNFRIVSILSKYVDDDTSDRAIWSICSNETKPERNADTNNYCFFFIS